MIYYADSESGILHSGHTLWKRMSLNLNTTAGLSHPNKLGTISDKELEVCRLFVIFCANKVVKSLIIVMKYQLSLV